MMTLEQALGQLEGLIHYIAREKSSSTTVMMDPDEIVGELMLELVKGYEHYRHKNLTDAALLSILKTMFYNRVKELLYKYFLTHRGEGTDYLPLHQLEGDTPGGDSLIHMYIKEIDVVFGVTSDPADYLESQENYREFLSGLSYEALLIVNAIRNGNDLLSMNVQLSLDRASTVYKTGGTVTLQPWHIADSLGMSMETVTKAMEEIKQAYAQVYYG